MKGWARIFPNTDHTSILSWVGLILPSHFLDQLGLKCCWGGGAVLEGLTEVQEENIRTSIFFNLIFFHSV